MVELPNARGENILLFLVQTVGRQIIEQRQYRNVSKSKRARYGHSRKFFWVMLQKIQVTNPGSFYQPRSGQVMG